MKGGEAMNCARCNGLLVIEEEVDELVVVRIIRCVNCGWRDSRKVTEINRFIVERLNVPK